MTIQRQVYWCCRATGVAVNGTRRVNLSIHAHRRCVAEAKEILGEFISLQVSDPIRFAAVLQLILETRHFILHSQREFQFEFDFWPRNARERGSNKIIHIFKYNSSHRFCRSTQQSVFTTPNYWKVSYMYNNGETHT